MVGLTHSTCGNILFGSLNAAPLWCCWFVHDPRDCPNHDTRTSKHLQCNGLTSIPSSPAVGHTPESGLGPRKQLSAYRGSNGRLAADAPWRRLHRTIPSQHRRATFSTSLDRSDALLLWDNPTISVGSGFARRRTSVPGSAV